MASPAVDLWTLVQHSGFVRGGHDEFECAVQTAHVDTVAEANTVRRAGGVLFASYREADEAETTCNYPDDGYDGLVPVFKGAFSTLCLEDSPIAIPNVTVVHQ